MKDKLSYAIKRRIAEIVLQEGRPFTYRDLMSLRLMVKHTRSAMAQPGTDNGFKEKKDGKARIQFWDGFLYSP